MLKHQFGTPHLPPLQLSFGGGQVKVVDVAPYSHLDCSGKSLEDGFYLMVLVCALGVDVQVHQCTVAKAFKEVVKHLGGHFSNLLTLELHIPYQPWTSAEVECHTAQTIVHRKAEAIALYAALVA